MLSRRPLVLRLELFDQSLHVLGPRARHDEDCIGCRDYNDVIEADYRCEYRFFGAHKAIAGVRQANRPLDSIACRIVVEHIPYRTPAADIGPANIDWNDRRALCALHDRIVDRLLWRACERLRRKPHKIEITCRVRY